MLTKAPPFFIVPNTIVNLTQNKKHSCNTHECQLGLVYVSIIELSKQSRRTLQATLIISHKIKKATVHLKRRKKIIQITKNR